jgi:glutamate racemase
LSAAGDRSIGSSADDPIGVFDSGVGGLSILNALREELPAERFVYFADAAHAPYGERGDAYVAERSAAVARHLRARHRIKSLVVACNTATAAAIHALREAHPALPVVGVEPALKPAIGLSRTGHIAVLATRVTLASRKFEALHALLADQARFSVVACDGLAGAIEAGDAGRIGRLCAQYLAVAGGFGDGPGQHDTLVLGCTHYPFIADELRRQVGDTVRFVDTGAPVALQTRRLLEQAGLLADGAGEGELLLCSSAAPASLDAAAARWLHRPPARRATLSDDMVATAA